MDNLCNFKSWLKSYTHYTDNVVGDVVYRLNRAHKLINISGDCNYYIFMLEQKEEFKNWNPSVKSQVKKAVRLYYQFQSSNEYGG